MPFNKETYSNSALNVATSTRERIMGVYVKNTGNFEDIISLEDALPIDDDFVSKITKPSHHTLLHKFIENYLYEEYYYGYRKYEDNYPELVYDLLDTFKINYTPTNYIDRNSNYELFELAQKAFSPLSHEAFCILFSDRKTMQYFSRIIKNILAKNNLRPAIINILTNQGNIPRTSSWPKWLTDALFHRDNGRCSICSCDLTGLIATDRKIHIDHINPLSQFGTNDPTNLQILCDNCNLKKGNRTDATSTTRHVPWNLPLKK